VHYYHFDFFHLESQQFCSVGLHGLVGTEVRKEGHLNWTSFVPIKDVFPVRAIARIAAWAETADGLHAWALSKETFVRREVK
jgi:hypothetical protein